MVLHFIYPWGPWNPKLVQWPSSIRAVRPGSRHHSTNRGDFVGYQGEFLMYIRTCTVSMLYAYRYIYKYKYDCIYLIIYFIGSFHFVVDIFRWIHTPTPFPGGCLPGKQRLVEATG